MVITETSISTANTQRRSNLLGFCTVVFDNELAVRDIRIIQSPERIFVAVPSSKRTEPCRCGMKNPFTAKYCQECGAAIRRANAPHISTKDTSRQYHDIVNPINNEFREYLESEILEAYFVQTDTRNAATQSDDKTKNRWW